MMLAVALLVTHISYLDTRWEKQGSNNHKQLLVLFLE